MNAITIPCGFAVAWTDHWSTGKRWLTVAAALQLVGLVGIVTVPSAGWAWAVVLGIAIGPLFPLTLPLALLPDVRARAGRAASELGLAGSSTVAKAWGRR